MQRDSNCPICLRPIEGCEQSTPSERLSAACPICGEYTFANTPRILSFSKRERFKPGCLPRLVLSHRVRQMTLHRSLPRVTDEIVQRAIDDPTLPTPAEQLDNLVLFLGEQQEDTGLGIRRSVEQWTAIIGARSDHGVRFVFVAAEEVKLAERTGNNAAKPQIRLTFAGWQRYENLKRARVTSRRAFMGMKFGDEVLDRLVGEHFRPAVKQAGFDLLRVDQDPKAGSIDDRIRVAIRTSRFMIADLTHDNSGVYWEAGFAEGLGRPVIYTCEQKILDDKGTHFDTRNLFTVPWSADEPGLAAEKLKAAIRATLADEAILEDRPAG